MQDTEEIWKDIPEFIDHYQASSLGNIRRIDTTVNHSKGGNANKKGRIIKQSFNRRIGYMRVGLCFNGRKITRPVHVMIARTFVSNPMNLPEANHKDGNKLNNRADNFEWVTKSQNRIHAINLNLIKNIPPDKLLTKSKIHTLKALNEIGYNQFDLANIFKLSQSTVSRALNGKRRYAIILTNGNSHTYPSTPRSRANKIITRT